MANILEGNFKTKGQKGNIEGYAYINLDNVAWFERGLIAGTTRVYFSANVDDYIEIDIKIDDFRKRISE